MLGLDARYLHVCGSQTWWYLTINFFSLKAFSWGLCLDQFGAQAWQSVLREEVAPIPVVSTPAAVMPPPLRSWLHEVVWGGDFSLTLGEERESVGRG